jgi:hypothetical protein
VASSSGKRRTGAFPDPPPSPRTPEHACEGRGGGPGFDSADVGREDRAGDVRGTDEADYAAFDDRDRVPAVPDIFADQGAGGLVVLGDAAALAVRNRVDSDLRRQSQRPDRKSEPCWLANCPVINHLG